MKLRHLIGVAAATFGLALAAQAAPAGPAPGSTALAWTPNGVTLAGGHGPHGGSGSGGYSGPHSYGGGGGYSGLRSYSGSGSYSRPHSYSGSYSGSQIYSRSGSYKGPHTYSGSGPYKGPHIYSRNNYRTYGAYGHHDGWRHHRGHWRGGWYGWGPGTDESCFAECRSAGYSPAYCTANAWSFC
jgi:hypothetical protein